MQGYTVLFLPGYDHAGIATQAVVEQRLIKTEGHGRHHYGREKFLERVWDWKDQCVVSSTFRSLALLQISGEDHESDDAIRWLLRLGPGRFYHE